MRPDKVNRKLIFYVCSKYILLIPAFPGRGCEKQNIKGGCTCKLKAHQLMRGSTVVVELISYFVEKSHDKQY